MRLYRAAFRRFIWIFLVGLVLFVIPRQSLCQEYYFQNFSGKDGLAQSQVYALLEDRQGYLWMGTWGGGLSQFDGNEFVNHTQSEGLLSNYVFCLAEDQQQQLWIGTDKGLCRFDGRQYQNFLTERKTPVYTLHLGRQNRLWIGTQRGLYFVEEGEQSVQPSEYPELRKIEIRACFEDQHGFLWLGSAQGVFILSPTGNVRHLKQQDGWNGFTAFGILEDASGTIWLGTEGGGIQWSDGTRIFGGINEAQGLSSNRILHLHAARTGEIWAGTADAGINIWNSKDSTIMLLLEKDGLESNDIRSIIEDSWGNHWVGTSGGGVSKYSGRQFVLYDEADGLADKEVYGIDKDSLGHIWLSTSQGISRFDGRYFKHFGADENWPTTKSRAVLSDRQGRIWAGFDNKGLGLFAADTFRLFNAENGVGTGLIRDLIQDSLGAIWVASTTGGLTKVVPDPADSTHREFLFYQYNRTTGFPANYIYALLIDQSNRLWFATRYQGLGYFDKQGSAVLFDRKDGLPDIEVRTLTMDSLGHCWAGTARGGIFRFALDGDSLVVKSFDQSDQLTSNNIYQLVFDSDHQLWVGHEKGVDRVRLDEGLDIAEVVPFGYAEGFKGGETCNGAVICDAAGDLWFGTMNGLTHYRPGSGRKNTVAPKVHFQQVRLFYQPLEKTAYAGWSLPGGGLRSGLVLPHHQNHLGFFFKGINHSNQGKVTYEWWLEGYENQWSPRTTANSVNYSNLPPGFYRFKVRAFNEDGVTNAEPISLDFTINPPFWQRWWFRLLSVLLVLVSLSLFLKFRINQVRQKAKAEREHLEMEKHLLTLEQKALQLQMNPHFIFNALNSIQYLISRQDHQKARYQLAKFSKLMRSTLENSRESEISLAEEIQSLESYLALEQFSRNHSFEYKIVVADDLDPTTLNLPPMMIQPFVENAIIHGVAHLADRKGEIEIQFSRNDAFLECRIMDNGIGRKAAAAVKSQQDEQHKSAALEVTRERLELLGGTTGGQFSIEDRLGEDGEVKGTLVLLKIPLSGRS